MCMYQGSLKPPEKPAAPKTIEAALVHVGADLKNQNSALISDFARNMIMGPNGFEEYLWFNKREGTMRCTACGQEMPIKKGLCHKEYARCPECGKIAMARNMNISHKKLRQEFYAVEWRKSETEKNAVIMIGIYCGADYRGCEMAEKVIVPVQLDVFAYGKYAKRFQRSVWDFSGKMGECPWYLRRDVRAIGGAYFGGKKPDVLKSYVNFLRTIEGTPFKSAFDTIMKSDNRKGVHRTGDMCEIISAIARRPWIEYMIKAGFENIGRSAIYSIPAGIINPRKKSVRDILMLSKDRYAELKGKRADITSGTLDLLHRAEKAGARITLDEAQRLDARIGAWMRDEIFKRCTLDRAAIRYLLKNDASELRDYWEMANRLGMDISDPALKFPQNLRREHDRLSDIIHEQNIRRRNAVYGKTAEDNQGKLEKRMPALEKKYCFEANGLILRPARELAELIREGNSLRHCVASYITRYAEGGTDICFLRRAEDPETPWRTIEFSPRTGAIVQDRGYKNDRDHNHSLMTPQLQSQLDAFWAAYRASRETRAGAAV